MSDLQELTNELMNDEEFRREYEAIQPELNIIAYDGKYRKRTLEGVVLKY